MQANNPYIAGSPLRDPEGFFGRRDIIDWVSAELSNFHTNALVLYGQRRVGKTTILLQLRHSLSSDKFLPIYFDLQDQAKLRLGEVLANLADSVGSRINLNGHNQENFDDEGKYFRSVFLPDLYRVLDKESRPVFLLDEFDVLDQGDEGSLENDVASRALFPLLRQVMDDDIRPAFVFVVGRRTEDLRVDFNQMFKTSLTKEVWVLDRLSAETLIRQAEVNGTLKFAQQSIDRILQLTKSHAYLTQLVCQRLWQRSYAGKPAGTPTINVDDVTASIPDALEVGEQALIWLWNGLGPAEKIYAAVLAEISNEGKAISEDEVIKVLAEHAARARLRRREVELAPQDLITRHVLELTENREYIFAIELFRQWVKQKRSLKDVVDEIDKVDPLAQRLFEIGQDFYKERKWGDAVRYFNDALRQNPSHFRANLLLGETFLAMEQAEDAVRQLEIASSLDSYESQYPLARALIALAKEKEKNGLDQDALSAAERALVVSPNERLAQDIKKSILERQGDNALKQGDLKAALFAFEKAENAEKVKQVEREYKLKELQILEQEANSFAQKKDWKQAILAYEQLIEKAPDEKSKAVWQSGLAKCKEEEKLESLFTLGLGALTSGDWEQAKKTLSEVVYIRPDYAKDNKSAVKLLEQAVAGRKPVTIETIFQSNLFRIFGSISLLVVIGYFVFSAVRGVAVETQEPTQVASTSSVESSTPEIIPTVTKTKIPTVTPTLTLTSVPQSSILLQEDFEDGEADGWGKASDTDYVGTWVIEQETNGNHYWSGTGPTAYPQNWYGDATLNWTDYAFENRIQFVTGGTIFICIRSDSGSAFYTVYTDGSYFDLSEYNPSKGIEWTSASLGISASLQRNKWYTVRLEISGSELKTYVDNKLVLTHTLSTPLINIQGGIGYYMGGGEKFYIDDIKVWSLGESSTSTEITDAKGATMVLVPDEDFTMGSDTGEDDEKPIHSVHLGSFYIDKYEVSNALYKDCVSVSICETPSVASSRTHSDYYGNSEFDSYPVIYIDWNMAKTYCEWRDARLPTEAEWEKAARGVDGRTYPWGEGFGCSKGNSFGCIGDVTKVGSYENGQSIYGVFDLSGNVWEWVGSLYKPYPYNPTDGRENLNSSGQIGLRGGSWLGKAFDNRSSNRYGANPYVYDDVGFRCARDVNP